MAKRPQYLTRRQKEILEFISEFQQEQGISPTHREICDHFGYSSYGTVYKHLRLLQEKGFLQREWNQKRGIELTRRAHQRLRSETGLPFEGRIAAGQPIEAVRDHDRIEVPHYLLGRSSGDHYVLEVVGDSMIEEGIQEGDLVVVSSRKQAEPGEMVVALVSGEEATLKRIYPEGERVRLQPSNPAMKPIFVPAREVQVQGVVVGLMRRF